MSGLRLYNFREGDRSEYLANYLLSGLGLITPVPRQEDIGFDFYCQLADQESGPLTFGYPFIVQVKSSGTDKIVYGNPDSLKWKTENINWIFRLELPLLLGIVNKKNMSISFYNTSLLHFIFFKYKEPSLLELIPRAKISNNVVDEPSIEKIPDWPEDKGDGHKYSLDLGNPILTLDNEDLHDEVILNKKKKILRKFLMVEQTNLMNRRLNILHFQWTREIIPNEHILYAWIFLTGNNQKIIDDLLLNLGPSLVSLAMNLRRNGKTSEALSLKPILKQIPEHLRPPTLVEANPDLFD